MAVSRKRKRAGKVVKRAVVELPKRDLSKQWSLKIKASQFIYLKDDPDFLAMVKFGRAINALSFASTVVASWNDDHSNVGKRQYRRGLFVLAGYLHQTINIIRGVEDRHITMDAFVPLRAIAHDPKYAKVRKYAKTIRNYTAFHLDEFDEHENTKRSLSSLDPSMHVLMGADNNLIGTFYFEFADYLDYALVGSLFQGERTPEETAADITSSIVDTSFELLEALHAFQLALAKKMELEEYVYR
ncbi:MAG TPA: hypothetical protein PKD24_09700 [Pyrinomonadaceae bacterium]|nr:hypothetical protein [Pyrinomonadaceae bacterium]HMP65657.1 hypothetical protein [Pyrinomonadaceae bacterium]